MEDFGKVVLRVSLGVIMLLHGIFKIRHGVSFLTPLVQGIGLPPWFAYGAYFGEVVGPVMLILGLGARIGAFLVFANMVFAIVLVHRPDFFSLTKQGGWTLELQGMFLFTAFALMFLNPGRYAISRRF